MGPCTSMSLETGKVIGRAMSISCILEYLYPVLDPKGLASGQVEYAGPLFQVRLHL